MPDISPVKPRPYGQTSSVVAERLRRVQPTRTAFGDSGLRQHRPPTTEQGSRPVRSSPSSVLMNARKDINIYVEVVHRLSALGIVVTQAAHGTSHQGFEAEWRENSPFSRSTAN